MAGQNAHWAEYTDQLYMADPLSRQFSTAGLLRVDADHPTDETLPCLGNWRFYGLEKQMVFETSVRSCYILELQA